MKTLPRRRWLAALVTLAATSLALPTAVRAQRRPATAAPPAVIQFASEQPPLGATATVMRSWFGTHAVDRIAQPAANARWHVFMATFFARAPGVARVTVDWFQLGPNGARVQLATDNVPIEEPASRMLVRELNLPSSAGAFEPGHEYEVVVSAPGTPARVLATARLRLGAP